MLDRPDLLADDVVVLVGDLSLVVRFTLLSVAVTAAIAATAAGAMGRQVEAYVVAAAAGEAGGARQFAARVLAALAAHHFCAAGEHIVAHTSNGVVSGDAPSGELACEQGAIPLTASAGAAVYLLDSALPLELIVLADRALYDGKHLGGNQVVVVNQALRDSLAQQDTSFGVLDGLVTAVDAKDRYTRAHSEHVAALAAGLAEEIGLPDAVRQVLHTAGLLHDVGKIGMPDHILRKPGRLSEEERRIIQQHVTLSEMIIQGVPRVEDVLAAVVHHHERWDGGGYPRGLAGERIPLLGRVLAIADAHSAMALDRPYRKALAAAEALAELARAAGTQLDPALVPPFLSRTRAQPETAAARSEIRAALPVPVDAQPALVGSAAAA